MTPWQTSNKNIKEISIPLPEYSEEDTQDTYKHTQGDTDEDTTTNTTSESNIVKPLKLTFKPLYSKTIVLTKLLD